MNSINVAGPDAVSTTSKQSSIAASKLSKRHLKALEAYHAAMRIQDKESQRDSQRSADFSGKVIRKRPMTSCQGSVSKLRHKIKAEISKQLDAMDKEDLTKLKNNLVQSCAAEFNLEEQENEYGLVTDDRIN